MFNIQWGLEYRVVKFRIHSQSKCFDAQIWDGLVFEWLGTIATAIAMVPNIQKQNKYIGIQDLVQFGMVGLFVFGMPFKIRTIVQHPNNFRPFKKPNMLGNWAHTVLHIFSMKYPGMAWALDASEYWTHPHENYFLSLIQISSVLDSMVTF